jgi:hypothetical protein
VIVWKIVGNFEHTDDSSDVLTGNEEETNPYVAVNQSVGFKAVVEPYAISQTQNQDPVAHSIIRSSCWIAWLQARSFGHNHRSAIITRLHNA